MMSATNIHFEMAERSRALNYGGIGAMHLMGPKGDIAIRSTQHFVAICISYFQRAYDGQSLGRKSVAGLKGVTWRKTRKSNNIRAAASLRLILVARKTVRWDFLSGDLNPAFGNGFVAGKRFSPMSRKARGFSRARTIA